MMNYWFNIFKHLLPRAKAWRITIDKMLRYFFIGLAELPSDVKDFFDGIFDDIDPQKTRQLDLWETVWALRQSGLDEQGRRDRLDATWAAKGGQDPRYIQDTLQAQGFDVYVHEWWRILIEIVTNGDFSSTTIGWTVNNGSIASVAGGKSGNCLELTEPTGAVVADVFQDLTTIIGVTYTVKIWVNRGTGADVGFTVAAEALGLPSTSITGIATSTWILHTFDFTALATTTTLKMYKEQVIGDILFDTITVNPLIRTCGGSVNGDSAPFARNPNLYLDDGTGGAPWLMLDGDVGSMDGDLDSMDGKTATPAGYPLVNKISETEDKIIGDGYEQMQDNELVAADGTIIIIRSVKEYIIPGDTTKYPYFLYIGGETFPESALVKFSRKDEFEDLCLKICPTEQWLGILVIYS